MINDIFYLYFQENKYQWRIVYWVTAIVWFVANLIFITFGTGELQNLNEDTPTEEPN